MKLPLHFALSLLLSGALCAQEYAIVQSSGNDTFGARSTGQTFTPNVGIAPDPGPIGGIPLVQIKLYHGNYPPAAPSATTWLHVYIGDPNAGGVFVASSTNTVDTTNLNFRDEMVWDFPSIPVPYNQELWAVMASQAAPGGLNIAVSLETASRNGPNAYTGGAGLIANIAKHPNDVDAKFEVVFHIGVRGHFIRSGGGCPGAMGVAPLSGSRLPTIGQPLQFDIDNVAATATPLLAFGASATNWNGVPLPFALNNLLPGAAASCQILCSVDIAAAMQLTQNRASLTLNVPNQANFAGVTLLVQGWILDGANANLTELGDVLIGN